MTTLTDKAFAASLLAILAVALIALLAGNEARNAAEADSNAEWIPRVTVTAKRLSAEEKRAMDLQERQIAGNQTAGDAA